MAAGAEETKLVPVKLRQSLASPGFSAEKGDIVNVNPLDAHRLVKRGIAEVPEKMRLPDLSAEEAKRVGVLNVATVKAKGNRARVEPVEAAEARLVEEKRQQRESRRNGGGEDDSVL